MAYIPAKIIESELLKEGISVNGYLVIENIEIDYLSESKRLGMADAITGEFEFSSVYIIDDIKIIFYGRILEDYKDIGGREILYYYPILEMFKISTDGEEDKNINIDVYWKS